MSKNKNRNESGSPQQGNQQNSQRNNVQNINQGGQGGGNTQGGGNKQQFRQHDKSQHISPTDLQVDEDKNTHKWTVHPSTRSANEAARWAVECNSKGEAQNLKNDIVNGRLKPPTEAPQSYGAPHKHQNGKTMVYAKAS